MNKNSSAPSDDIARIAGTRLLVTAEPKQGMILDVAKIKQLTGGDRILARFLHENSFEFVPSCSIFFNANHKMRVLDNTLFSSDRLDLIEFTRHFSREERDTSLKQQFTTETAQSAIMNWILDGLFLYRKERLIPPEQVQNATDQYAQESDKFTQFANDCIEAAADSEYFTLAAAYDRFKVWTKENGFGTESKTNFNRIMRTKFEETTFWGTKTALDEKKTTIRGVKGYKLTN
jgi:putative DNA primase/helicase